MDGKKLKSGGKNKTTAHAGGPPIQRRRGERGGPVGVGASGRQSEFGGGQPRGPGRLHLPLRRRVQHVVCRRRRCCRLCVVAADLGTGDIAREGGCLRAPKLESEGQGEIKGTESRTGKPLKPD